MSHRGCARAPAAGAADRSGGDQETAETPAYGSRSTSGSCEDLWCQTDPEPAEPGDPSGPHIHLHTHTERDIHTYTKSTHTHTHTHTHRERHTQRETHTHYRVTYYIHAAGGAQN